MRKVVTLVLATTLTTCATAPQVQLYRPEGEGRAWAISGKFDTTTKDLQVLIDGEPALAGSLWYSGPSGTIKGNHKGHPVRADCVDYQDDLGGTFMVLCDVFVDRERAALLTFN